MCMCMHACVRACKRQDPPAADHGAVDSSGTTRRRGLAVTSLECFYNLDNGNGNEECLKPWDWCTLHNGNGEMLHNGNGKTLHNGNGKTLYNGNGKTLHNGNGGMLHNGNGKTLHNENGKTLYNGNGKTLYNGNGKTLYNGNGGMLHNGNGKTLHNGNGKTLYNGNGKTLHNGNGGMLHITPTSCVEKSSNGLCPSDHTSYITIPKLHTSLFVVYLR